MRTTYQIVSWLSLAAFCGALDNGVASRPPMGWSSWNNFQRDINATVFYESAKAISENGMQDAGYEYVNIDGGWWEGSDTGIIVRNASGFVQVSSSKFPDGLEPVIEEIHALGLRYGHYTDAGEAACNLDVPMSEGYEHQDAALFMSWGIDMIKVDACWTTEENEVLMRRWQQELNASTRPILFSNCRNGCLSDSEVVDAPQYAWAPWCAETTNMWRTSFDINATWKSFLANTDTLKGRGEYASPGAWNDPDILEAGVGEFEWDGTSRSINMNRAHFSLWCITSSPLLAGHDVRTAPQGLTDILTNRQAIEINQQYAGHAGDVITVFNASAASTVTDTLEVWLKPLEGASVAVALFNRHLAPYTGSEEEEVVEGASSAAGDNNKAAQSSSSSSYVVFEFADIDPLLLGLPADSDLGKATCMVQGVWEETITTETGRVENMVWHSAVKLLVISDCFL